MLVVNSNIQSQAYAGSTNTKSADIHEAAYASGWSLFIFDGVKPATEAEARAYMNTQSLADLYNKSIAIGKTTLKGVFGETLLDQHQRVLYQAKGVTYCEFIGGGTLSLLTPDRILENPSTKRSLSLHMTRPTAAGVLPKHVGTDDTILEFDTPVILSHIVRYGTELNLCEVVALKPLDGGAETEVPLGILTLEPGETHLYKFKSPTAAKKFIVKRGTATTAPFDLLSFSTEPADVPLTEPSWCALVHTNNFAHGDIFYSPELMYIIDDCKKEGPYVTTTNLKANKVNYVYCPKIRLDNWRS